MTGLLSDLLSLDRDGIVSRVSDAATWDTKAEEIRARIAPILGAGPIDAPPLDLDVHEEVRCERYTRKLVSYRVEADDRVSAYLLVPNDKDRPMPAMLCLHPTTAEGKREPAGLGAREGRAYAHELAERGYVTLAPDHLAAGDRIAPGLEAYDTSAFYRKHPGWSAVGKGIHDARRAVDALCTLSEVDARRIGVMGHSLGGHSSVFAAAYDERLRVCVSNCGMTTFADNPGRLAWARERWYVYLPALRRLFLADLPAPFDLHEVAALIAPRAFLNISSLTDDSTPLSGRALQEMAGQLRELYGALGARERFAVYLHDCGHAFPPEARALAYGWIDRHLRQDAVHQ